MVFVRCTTTISGDARVDRHENYVSSLCKRMFSVAFYNVDSWEDYRGTSGRSPGSTTQGGLPRLSPPSFVVTRCWWNCRLANESSGPVLVRALVLEQDAADMSLIVKGQPSTSCTPSRADDRAPGVGRSRRGGRHARRRDRCVVGCRRDRAARSLARRSDLVLAGH